MSLTGTWQNSYGSTMSLTQLDDGLVAGTYRSSTGSTGSYHVLGHAAPTTPSQTLGQPLALTILWRSIDGGTPDPSWHWVSGLGGQLTPQAGVPTLILLHALVATDAFPDLAPPGSYLDKLIYTPHADAVSMPPSVPLPTRGAAVGDPIDATWICEQDAALTLQLSLIDAANGVVQGAMAGAGSRLPLCGFTDTHMEATGRLQGLALAVAWDAASGLSRCLAGSLDRDSDRLRFTVFDSRGTAAGTSYVQTRSSVLTFRRA